MDKNNCREGLIGTSQSHGALRIALPILLAIWCSSAAAAHTFEVGPGKIKSLAAVPWDSLKAGDRVNIHWRQEPYREKVLLSAQGTAKAPIRISGIPNAEGKLPVIDGENATTAAGKFPYEPTQDRGLFILTLGKGGKWGEKPKYVILENLEFRGAAPGHRFQDVHGSERAFSRNAAGIFVERGEHIVVRGCRIVGNGNGLFVASGGSEEVQSRDIRVQDCEIEGNGVPGSDREHNVYTEAIRILFERNRFGRPCEGSLGSNLKDRSAGTVIRGNRFEGGANMIDLVDAEESWRITASQKEYAETLVAENHFDSRGGDGIYVIHFGGDTGFVDRYRKHLTFRKNTVEINAEQAGRWRTMLFRCETNGQTIDADENRVLLSSPSKTPATELSLMCASGTLRLGKNLLPKAVLDFRTGTASDGAIIRRK